MLEADLETLTGALALFVAEFEQAGADDGLHRALAVHGQCPDAARFAVGNKKELAVAAQAAGLSELGRTQRAVPDVLIAVAGVRTDGPGLEVHHPDLVVAGHADEKRIALQI